MSNTQSTFAPRRRQKQGTELVLTITSRPQWAFYPNAPAAIPFNSGIHPGGRSPSTKFRKRSNSIANHQLRAETNRRRSQSPLSNPNWHGIGHA